VSLSHRRMSNVLALAAAVLMAVATLTACSSSRSKSDSGGDKTSATPAAEQSGGAPSSGADGSPDAALKKAYAGVTGQAPTPAVKPPAHAFAWIVSCGQQVPTCAGPAQAAVAAAKAVGWKATLCDGKLNPQGWAACIRQGITAKASGVLVIGQDCNSFQAALQEANGAGIPTIGTGGNDCDVTGGKKLYAGTVQNLAHLDAKQWWAEVGALQADWIIGKSNGKANVLSLQFTDAIWGGWIQDGFKAELATCSGCKIADTLRIGNADVAGGKLPQKFGSALLRVPTANAVNVPLDGWFFAGLSQAIQSSGRANQLSVIGSFGEPGNLDLIHKGMGEDATVAFNAEWVGWAGVDSLARVLAKQPLQPAGVGLQVVDADHNMPAAGEPFDYTPAADYEGAYKNAWGLS
jgi:ribose transport system substrate-binding protein